MSTISISYTLKYQIKGHPQYQVTECRKVFNIKTGKQLKRCYNSGSIGYWIEGQWYNINTIKLQKIEKTYCPF
jgi:hypothetical protein